MTLDQELKIQEKMMRRAIVLARRGVGKTAPNPAVGCVVARDGVVAGEGWHRKAGTPHAEVHALRSAGEAARGADLFVTLEPCAHFGKTPPCAEAVIKAGVKRVFAAMVDPNPAVSGRGLEMLRQAGIEVHLGLKERESRQLNEPFIKHITTGLPYVILKSAMTLDGATATGSGDSKWITNDKSRLYVHKLRGMVDAIMVGVGTIAADDPQLTCRIAGGKDPARVIVDSALKIPLQSRVLHLPSCAPTIIATGAIAGPRAEKLGALNVEILTCRQREGRVDLQDLLCKLGARGVQSVLLEGGSTLAGEAVRQQLVDKYLLFYGPKIVGGAGLPLFSGNGAETMAEALRLTGLKMRRFGEDFMVEGYPEGRCLPVWSKK